MKTIYESGEDLIQHLENLNKDAKITIGFGNKNTNIIFVYSNVDIYCPAKYDGYTIKQVTIGTIPV